MHRERASTPADLAPFALLDTRLKFARTEVP